MYSWFRRRGNNGSCPLCRAGPQVPAESEDESEVALGGGRSEDEPEVAQEEVAPFPDMAERVARAIDETSQAQEALRNYMRNFPHMFLGTDLPQMFSNIFGRLGGIRRFLEEETDMAMQYLWQVFYSHCKPSPVGACGSEGTCRCTSECT